MPEYEYTCTSCGKKFAVSISISEHDKAKVRCPKCQSPEIEQLPPHVYVKTSKKS